jgi:tetratricopeptide (TPR) repeat protein
MADPAVHTVRVWTMNRIMARPYLGQRPFLPADRDRFWGRATEAAALARWWQDNRLTYVVGEAGRGKTSLLNAGVLPLLDTDKVTVLPVGQLSHGMAFPFAALPSHNPYTLALLRSWAPAESVTRLVGQTISRFLERQPGDAPVLAAIDTADELLAESGQRVTQRRRFLDDLSRALHDVKRLHLLVVGREDAVQVVGNTLGGGSKHEIAKLSRPGAVQAITRPMTATGRTFADGAAEKLVTDLQTSVIGSTADGKRYVTDDRVDPSLLQVACAHFAEALPLRDIPVTVEDVRRYADLDTALADHLGAIIAEVADDHDLIQKELRSWLLRTFVTDLGTRGKAYEGTATTAGMPNAVARTLEDRHVLIARRDSGSRWYELLSDRLIQPLREVTDVSPPPPQPARYLRLAEHALTLGQLDLAERYAREITRHPHLSGRQLQAEAYSLLGNLCYEREKPQEAERFYRDAMAQFEAASNTWMVALQLAAVGQVLLSQGRFAMAAEVLRGAATRAPGDLVIRVAYARALWRLGADRAAIAELTLALGIDGSDAAALRARGEILADLGKPVDALRDLDRVASSGSVRVVAARGLALAELGDCRAARRAAEKVADDDAHNDGTALLYAARTFALCGDDGRAADLARQAADAADPPLDPPHEGIARRLIDRGRGQPPI